MMPASVAIFGQRLPTDACAVRLRLRLRRKGNPPAVTVHTLTEEALIEAMQASDKFRAWVRQADRARSYPALAHRVFPGDLTWLDAAGRALDHPQQVNFPYEAARAAHCEPTLCTGCQSLKESPMNSITSLVPVSAPTVEPVPFLGGVLSALRSEGQGWLVLKPACDALGIDYSGQLQRLKTMPWATMGVIPTVAADGRQRDMQCLRAERVAMWLATIDVSRIADDEARQRLALWQCHAAEALDRWWRGTPSPDSSPEALEKQVARIIGLILPPLVEALRPRRAPRSVPTPEPGVFPVQDLLGALLRWAQLRDRLTFTAIDLFEALSDGGNADLQLRSLWNEFSYRAPWCAADVGNTLHRLRRRRCPPDAGLRVETLPGRSASGMTWRIVSPQ